MDYDYAIIGGGSAGCVLAHRLSARPANRVLLIESGQDTPPDQVPADILETFPKAALNPAYKWMKLLAYTQSLRRNVPQSPVLYDQGRVMGGGSSVNFQAANRGHPSDYDEWAEAGAAGWAWQDVLPYFRKLENDRDFANEFHGKGGPLPIERMKRAEWCGFSHATARALEEAGLGYLDDQNGPFVDGYFAATQNNTPAHRVSAAMAYLDAATRRRTNLRILSKSHVRELLFEGDRAIGATVETPQGDRNHPRPRDRARDRRGPFAGDADARRDRARGQSAGARHRGARQPSGRGREPARPSGRAGAGLSSRVLARRDGDAAAADLVPLFLGRARLSADRHVCGGVLPLGLARRRAARRHDHDLGQ